MEKDIYTVAPDCDRPDRDPAFAARLKEYRKKTINPETGRGYTQREFAAKIGVSTTSYNGYEHGVVPNMRRLKKLADVLQCSTDVLLGIVDDGENVQKMSSLGDVARAFLVIAASGCVNMKNLNSGTVQITNEPLRDFLIRYYELYNRLKDDHVDVFDEAFKDWQDKVFKELDSTPIGTNPKNIDAK